MHSLILLNFVEQVDVFRVQTAQDRSNQLISIIFDFGGSRPAIVFQSSFRCDLHRGFPLFDVGLVDSYHFSSW